MTPWVKIKNLFSIFYYYLFLTKTIVENNEFITTANYNTLFT